MASITKYKNKKGVTLYEARIYLGIVDGKRLTKHKKNFTTKKEASQWCDQQRYLVQVKGLPEPADKEPTKHHKILFETIAEEWLEQYRSQVRQSTFGKTRGLVKNHMLPVFQGKRMDQITTKQLQLFVNDLRNTLVNYGPAYNYTKNIFTYAADCEYILKNPFDNVKKPKPMEKPYEEKPENVLTKQELSVFLNACKSDPHPEAYPLFRLLAYSGLRRGELIALQWRDIDFKAQTLSVKRAATYDTEGKLILGKTKNKSSMRTIALDAETLRVLKDWKAQQRELMFALGHNTTFNPNQFLFPNHYNELGTPSLPQKWLKTNLKKAGLHNISLHGLRHTHCTLLIESGANIKDVQKRMGHSSIETTLQIYTHVNKHVGQQTVDTFSKYISG